MEELDDIYFAKGFKMSVDEYKKLVRGNNQIEEGKSEWVSSDEEEVKEIQSGI